MIVPPSRSVQDVRHVVDAAKVQTLGHHSSTNGMPHYQFQSIPPKVSKPVTNAATLVILMLEFSGALVRHGAEAA